ncbi:MAG: DMT family transporter [Candidatus Actinomarina sp.]|tara:strand:- start:481 stop:1326 length:846 start_codon:yes stop_codon:yes gene_type:complete
MKPTTRAYLGIVLLTISWGTIPLIIRTSDISSISLVGIRTFLGSIFLSLFILRKGFNFQTFLKPGLILGPLLAIHWVTMFESIELNSIAIGIGLVFSYPIFLLMFEYLKGTQLTLFQIMLIFIGFLGVYLLLEIESISSFEGVFYGIASAISLALIISIGEKFSNELGGLNVAFSQLVFAAIILFYFTLEGFTWLFDNLLVGMFLGFFLTGIGLSTYWYVVKIIKPISVSTISYLEPLTGVMLGVYLLGETINIRQLIGFFLVIGIGVLQLLYDAKFNSRQ